MTGRGDCGRGRFGDTGGHIAPQTSVWKADCPDYAPVSYTHLDVYKRQVVVDVAALAATSKIRFLLAPSLEAVALMFRLLNGRNNNARRIKYGAAQSFAQCNISEYVVACGATYPCTLAPG